MLSYEGNVVGSIPLRKKHPQVISIEAKTMTRCSPKALAKSVNRKQLNTLHRRNKSMISAGSLPVALENAWGFAAVAKQTQSLTNAKKLSINKCAQRFV
jgi:electron transfer flavoprotein alpha subunit